MELLLLLRRFSLIMIILLITGCQSPNTHSFSGGVGVSIDEGVAELLRPDIARDGVTFSGGEPLAQPEACAKMVIIVKNAGVHTIVYTGFSYGRLVRARHPAVQSILACTDILVDGPFVAAVKDESLTYRGSANQRAIDMTKTRQTGILYLADWD